MPDPDLRALRRLADPGPARSGRRPRLRVRRVGGAPAATASPRVPRWLTLLLLIAAVVVAYLAFAAYGQAGEDAELAHAPAAPEPETAAHDTRDAHDTHGALDAAEPRRDLAGRAERTSREARARGAAAAGLPAFATIDDLALVLPHGEPVAVAFHEASRPEALELTPTGRLAVNDNATKYTPPRDTGGPAYHVLSSRGRARPATSAVDVVVPPGGTASAPVTGTVVEAREYVLYGSVRDWRVVIQPEDRPDLHVVLIHVHEPAVRAGDRVEAGVSTLAVVRQLPFTSHVDYVVGERRPHLHIEVRPATATEPHDPNEPAMDAGERLEEVSGTRPGSS